MTRKIMTPSVTTAGQIDKAVAKYRAMLEKHAGDFDSRIVQTVLGQSVLASEQFGVFRRRVELASDMFVRRVTLDQSLSFHDALSATGCKQFVGDDMLIDDIPRGVGDKAEVIFFKPKPWEYSSPGVMHNDELEKAFDRRGLKAANLYAVARVNEFDQTFANQYHHVTHWKDSSGAWCFAEFSNPRGYDPSVSVNLRPAHFGWLDYCYFAGERKGGV